MYHGILDVHLHRRQFSATCDYRGLGAREAQVRPPRAETSSYSSVFSPTTEDFFSISRRPNMPRVRCQAILLKGAICQLGLLGRREREIT